METQPEKVYVAIGTDFYDGLSTLHWTLRKWSDHRISIAILHASNTISKDHVYTPIGEVLEKTEETNSDKILSQYTAFCGKVETEVIIVEKNEQQPLHEQIVDIISRFRITKLVMSFGFMKNSEWKSRTAIIGSLHVVRHKPDFCEMFMICGGRSVFLRGENDEEGFIEDDRGFMIAKLKENNYSIRNWLEKLFPEIATKNSSSSPRSNDSPHQWEKCYQEIEHFVESLVKDEEEIDGVNAILKDNSTELCLPENMDAIDRILVLKGRIQNVQDTIHLNRKQANAAKERREKAEWAISTCNIKAVELEDSLNEEIAKNVDLKKELASRNKEIDALQSELEQKRSKLNSILQLQKELTNKLHMSSSAKARAEAQLEKSTQTRAETIQEIEKVRKQRDILQRRIEFCKEKDALGNVSKSNYLGFNFREFSAAEIIAATDDFSERLRLKPDIYMGSINHVTVEEGTNVTDLSNVPSAFLCPIYQDVMKNPHLAADGFSYEFEAIDAWLKTGHDTSPMTNLRLTHKLLTPNHTLRSLIQDRQNKGPADKEWMDWGLENN